jgi:signal transduction histidine kinase
MTVQVSRQTYDQQASTVVNLQQAIQGAQAQIEDYQRQLADAQAIMADIEIAPDQP